MNEYYLLYREDERNRLVSWWKSLEDYRGDRALLKRASSADDIVLSPAFARFLKFMPPAWSDNYRLFDSAMVAGLLARVDSEDDQNNFAAALAVSKNDGSKAVMSELRFQQLQKSRTADEFFLRMSRALALLKGKANIVSLADGVLHWLKEQRLGVEKNPQNRLAVRWATDYYSNLKD